MTKTATNTSHNRRPMHLGLKKWKVGAPKAPKFFGGSFSCVYRNAKGTLFTTPDGVLFVGKSFLFPKTIHIKWADILEIANHDNKHSQMIGSNKSSFSLLTSGTRKSKRLEFTKVEQSQQVVDTLVSLHNESLHDKSEDTSSMTSSDVSQDDDEVDMLLEAEWKKLEKDGSYSNYALQDKVLPCTLDTFYDTFVADSASHSTQEYQESNGDVDVSVTPWKLDEHDGASSRVVEFKHAVNIAVAPPFARARKEQRYHRYGPYGLLLETDTYVFDVPFASCFYVADRVLVEPCGQGQVVVHAKFDVRFIKRMPFQSLTASHTGNKYVEGFQNLEQYWSNALMAESRDTVQDVPPQPQVLSVHTRPGADGNEVVNETSLSVKQQGTIQVSKSPILFTNIQLMTLFGGLVSFLFINAVYL